MCCMAVPGLRSKHTLGSCPQCSLTHCRSLQVLMLFNVATNSMKIPTIARRFYYQLCSTSQKVDMAKSKFERVRTFESEDRCLPNCWLVVRLDGKGFHRFSDFHGFNKPNDDRSLQLMARAATATMREFSEVCIAYGQSDEFSFVFRRNAKVHNRRGMKITTNVCSLFTSHFIFHWGEFFPNTTLRYPPSFDGRIVLYPTDQDLRDYLSWRQADCHINNLYNTVFWALVQKGGLTPSKAEERLRGTLAGDKNEILFSEFGVNYNKEPQLHRKGTVLVRRRVELPKLTVPPEDGQKSWREKHPPSEILTLNVDVIGEEFWKEHPEILNPDPTKTVPVVVNKTTEHE